MPHCGSVQWVRQINSRVLIGENDRDRVHSVRFTLRQPIGLTILTQYQVGLYPLIGLALKQGDLVFAQGLRYGSSERRQIQRVFVSSRLHIRQVSVIQILARVGGHNIGVSHIQAVGFTLFQQVATKINQRIGTAFDLQRFIRVLLRLEQIAGVVRVPAYR